MALKAFEGLVSSSERGNPPDPKAFRARASSGEWGKWGTETEIRFEYASILPYLILLALAVTVGHLFCINKHGGRV